MAEVTRRHRELAFKVLGHSTDVNSYAECGRTLVKNWLERGIDGGPPMFEQESRCARAIADIEAEAIASKGGNVCPHVFCSDCARAALKDWTPLPSPPETK